jgi:probable phosphoglycerate mutase
VELWLVRHGESTWNALGRLQGGVDAPLSPRGRAQAAALAARLQGTAFDGLYTSPLRRARDTAAICARVLGLAPVPVEGFREIGLGAWEGLEVAVLRARDGEAYRRWLEAPADHPPPAGEPVERLVARLEAACAALGARHRGARILVVAHGGVIASLVCRWQGRPLNELWRVRVANGSITRGRWPDGHLLAVNETDHLATLAADGAVP